MADFGEEAMPHVRTPAETDFQTFDTSIVGDKVDLEDDLDIYCHVGLEKTVGQFLLDKRKQRFCFNQVVGFDVRNPKM